MSFFGRRRNKKQGAPQSNVAPPEEEEERYDTRRLSDEALADPQIAAFLEAMNRNNWGGNNNSIQETPEDHEESSSYGFLEDFEPSPSITESFPPPASGDAIVNLPHACLYSFESDKLKCLEGKECGVCFDSLSSGVAITRLPCGHVYHVNCIVGWLVKHCTCPECRYELPTNNKHYEIGRKERMKNRKTVSCSCALPYHTCFLTNDTFEQSSSR